MIMLQCLKRYLFYKEIIMLQYLKRPLVYEALRLFFKHW